MSKIALIIKREYITRVRKKSFLLMTILGPLIFAGIIFGTAILTNTKNENQRVVVVDYTKSFCGILENNSTVHFDYNYCSIDSNVVRSIFKDSSHVSVMVIPKMEELGQIQLYSKDDPGSDVVSAIEYQMDNIIEKAKMKAENLDQKTIDMVKTSIDVVNHIGENNKISNSDYNAVLGYISAFIIYFFILFYSVQVMRGVMEEKINRIVEIIISSVRPFQLMMGKVIGVGMVGLTQFLIWIILSFGVYTVGSKYLQNMELNTQNMQTEQTMKKGMPIQDNQTFSPGKLTTERTINKGEKIYQVLNVTNWVLIIGCFIFYFLGGYLLYSSLFAAVGSAVDQETETQQFMLPVTAPLILSIFIMLSIITNPQSNMAVWFSIIPFTSPIAMMARLPFGLPWWQLVVSMVVLIASILGTIWLAGRIYRVGLLMYGKKVSYKELGKWLFYK